jgi:AbrB family looped-hinge helix DNA binding protein
VIFGNKAYICRLHVYLSVIALSVEVGKYGRIVLPKSLRQKYGMREGIRLIITESAQGICLVPVETYERPTAALFGSVKTEKPVDEPKRVAREFIRRKLAEDFR